MQYQPARLDIIDGGAPPVTANFAPPPVENDSDIPSNIMTQDRAPCAVVRDES